MKKIILSFLMLNLVASLSFANCACEKKNNHINYESKEQVETKTDAPCEIKENKCDKCAIEDDEYCVYNQCFLNNQYKKMKKVLCLTNKQEADMDKSYKEFKHDMETYHFRYRTTKNNILEAIECDKDCYKDEIEKLKDIKKDTIERCKCFRTDVKNMLCKDQYKEFKRFQRQQKRKMKKIFKYSTIHKLPCVDCCDK